MKVPAGLSLIRSLAVALSASVCLSGCLALAVEALRNTEDPKGNFEANADGRVFTDYLEACYWKARYDPGQSLCGRMIESRESSEGVEYVHHPNSGCTYSFVVDKKTRKISSWRYVSAPEPCWVRSTSAQALVDEGTQKP